MQFNFNILNVNLYGILGHDIDGNIKHGLKTTSLLALNAQSATASSRTIP